MYASIPTSVNLQPREFLKIPSMKTPDAKQALAPQNKIKAAIIGASFIMIVPK